MSAEQNKAAVRRYYEEIGNQRNFAVADEIFDSNFKLFPDSLPPYGAEGVKQFMSWFIGVKFPDLHVVIDGLICEGDVVASRVTLHATQNAPLDWIAGYGSIAPTGKTFDLHEYIFWRVIDGRIVERWCCFDTLEMLYQLGAIDVNG